MTRAARMWRTWLRLPPQNRSMLVRATFVVVAVRLGLWVFPGSAVMRTIMRLQRPQSGAAPADGPAVDRVAWAVRVASRRVPAASCLTQAIATQLLLRRRALPSELRIGVKRDEQGEFRAHAWVESQGRAIIGGRALDGYSRLPLMRGKTLST